MKKKYTPTTYRICLFVLLLMSIQESEITSEIIAEKEFLTTSASLVMFQSISLY